MAGTIGIGGLSVGVDPRDAVAGGARLEDRRPPAAPSRRAVAPAESAVPDSADLARLRERIDAGTRSVDGLEQDLRRELAVLDVLAAHLERQAAFLARS